MISVTSYNSFKVLNFLTSRFDDGKNGVDDMEETVDGDEGNDGGKYVRISSIISIFSPTSIIKLL